MKCDWNPRTSWPRVFLLVFMYYVRHAQGSRIVSVHVYLKRTLYKSHIQRVTAVRRRNYFTRSKMIFNNFTINIIIIITVFNYIVIGVLKRMIKRRTFCYIIKWMWFMSLYNIMFLFVSLNNFIARISYFYTCERAKYFTNEIRLLRKKKSHLPYCYPFIDLNSL